MKHPGIKTKVVHSGTKPAWNVIGMRLGQKYKIARVPYVDVEGDDSMRSEALHHANFISHCFNKPDILDESIAKPMTEEEITDWNTNVVSQFMHHCYEEGLDIPDSMFESYFDA